MMHRMSFRGVAPAAAVAVTVFQFMIAAGPAEASYRTQPLPDEGSGLATALLIGGVTLALVGVVVAVTKGGDKDQPESQEGQGQADEEDSSSRGATAVDGSEPRTEALSRMRALELPDLMPLLGVGEGGVLVGFSAAF